MNEVRYENGKAYYKDTELSIEQLVNAVNYNRFANKEPLSEQITNEFLDYAENHAEYIDKEMAEGVLKTFLSGFIQYLKAREKKFEATWHLKEPTP